MIRSRHRYDIGKIIAGRVERVLIVIIANSIVAPIAGRGHEETSRIVCIGYGVVKGLGEAPATPAGVDNPGSIIGSVRNGLNGFRSISVPEDTEDS